MVSAREKAKIDVGEAVGTVAAQSLGEPGTQMSVPADERVIIKVGSEIEIVRIGQFVDSVMKEYGAQNLGGSEVFDFPREANVLALSLDKNEKLRWKKLLSCSRHKNAKKLIRIRTASGRGITATDAHSFVVRTDNKLVPVAGRKLKVGDRLPAIKYLPENCSATVGVMPHLPADFSVLREAGQLRSRRGLVPIPEVFELDEQFGWFVGAYLSEGHASTHGEVCVSNTDRNFISNLKGFADKFSLRYGEFDHERGFAASHDFKIRSALFSAFMRNTCGTGSDKKHVPAFAYSAKEEFVSGLLRGYFDGDGNVAVKRKMVRVSSNSEELLDGIKLLLTRFGIFAHKSKDNKQHWLLIPYKYALVFLSKIGSDIERKRKGLEELAEAAKKLSTTSQDYMEMTCNFGNILHNVAKKLGYPTRYVNNFTKRQKIGLTTLSRYITLFDRKAKEKGVDIKDELSVLRRMADADVVWDEIIGIERVQPESGYVYDFSVSDLETFATFDGIITHNTMRTFHYAGVAEQVPSGLPRLIELVDARKTPKKPMMDIPLEGDYAKDEKKAVEVAEAIECTYLENVAELRENFSGKVIEIVLNEDKLKEHGLTDEEVKKVIKGTRRGGVKIKGKIIEFEPRASSFRSIRRVTNKLRGMHVRGVSGVKRTLVVKGDKGKYFIRTFGTNLEKVMEHPHVDAYNVYVNDPREVQQVLGIEAARNSLVHEIKQVMDMQKLSVDSRHIMLLADAMTMDGEIRSIGRHGLSGKKAGVLARAAFEETIRHLVDAAYSGEEDRLIGVTENIIIGQTVPVGTGNVRLKMKLK